MGRGRQGKDGLRMEAWGEGVGIGASPGTGMGFGGGPAVRGQDSELLNWKLSTTDLESPEKVMKLITSARSSPKKSPPPGAAAAAGGFGGGTAFSDMFSDDAELLDMLTQVRKASMFQSPPTGAASPKENAITPPPARGGLGAGGMQELLREAMMSQEDDESRGYVPRSLKWEEGGGLEPGGGRGGGGRGVGEAWGGEGEGGGARTSHSHGGDGRVIQAKRPLSAGSRWASSVKRPLSAQSKRPLDAGGDSGKRAPTRSASPPPARTESSLRRRSPAASGGRVMPWEEERERGGLVVPPGWVKARGQGGGGLTEEERRKTAEVMSGRRGLGGVVTAGRGARTGDMGPVERKEGVDGVVKMASSSGRGRGMEIIRKGMEHVADGEWADEASLIQRNRVGFLPEQGSCGARITLAWALEGWFLSASSGILIWAMRTRTHRKRLRVAISGNSTSDLMNGRASQFRV